MRKRILNIILVLCLLCALLPVAALPVGAEKSDTDITYPVEGGNLYFDKATGTITHCDEAVTKADIPPEIDGVAVTSIGNYAFFECHSLTSVTIPNSVTSIGNAAFYDCSSLTSVTIPDSVTSISDSVFACCSSLTSVTIPNSVTSIGDQAFEWCSGLTSVTISDNATSIGDRVFSFCSSLTSVTIPNNVTSIGDSVFIWCSRLTAIDVAAGNTEYSSVDGVLFNKDQSRLITYPAGKTETEYSIPEGVTSIGLYSFFECSLTSVTIPDSVMSIGECAFWGCSSLTSVTIPDSVTSIGYRAFSACGSLNSVYFVGNAPEIGESVFQIWNGATEKYENIPNLTLYYIEGKDGWTSPTWNGYPTATWDGVNVPVSYADVSKTAWYYDAVQYATNNGLMNGVGGGKFDPEGSMTRAMLVTVLWRYEGAPMGCQNPFSDVPNGQWYTDAVAWAAENEIVGGVGNNRFDPDGNVTREQMAAILFRYANKKGIDTSKRGELGSFPDAGKISLYARDAIAWTVAEGVINGSDGRLLPQGDATRSQVSAILMRFIENIVKK